MSKMQASFKVASEFEWEKWRDEIPALNFPSDWDVRIIPPLNGAVVRFCINDKFSVFLDCYDLLGSFGKPYWEVYPDVDGEVFRCAMKDTESLMDKLEELVRKEKKFSATVETFEDGIKITTSKTIEFSEAVDNLEIRLIVRDEDAYDYNKPSRLEVETKWLSEKEFKVMDVDLDTFKIDWIKIGDNFCSDIETVKKDND